MKKTKPASCLHDYYGATQTGHCLMRVVLSKTANRPAQKEQKRKKGLYALGSN